jgi:hypothetical protein
MMQSQTLLRFMSPELAHPRRFAALRNLVAIWV